MTDLKKFAEQIADAIRDARAQFETGIASVRAYVEDAVGKVMRDARLYVDAGIGPVREAITAAEAQQAKHAEALRALGTGDSEARAGVAELRNTIERVQTFGQELRAGWELRFADTDSAIAGNAQKAADAINAQRGTTEALRADVDNLQAGALSLRNVVVTGFEDTTRRTNALAATGDALAGDMASLREALANGLKTAAAALAEGLVGVEGRTVTAARTAAQEAVDKAAAAIQLSLAGSVQEIFNRVAAIRPEKGEPGTPGRMTAPVTYEAGVRYPHNTTARHAGGLWHAYRDTDREPSTAAECGWSLLCNGVRAVGVQRRGERDVVIAVTLSDGTDASTAFTIPSLIYRGVHRDDIAYEAGDVTSHSGSAWAAKRANVGVRPGTPEAVDDWTLAVKRGKDGINASAERGLNWRDVYVIGMRCLPNDLVRTPGAVWICTRPTEEPPSTKSDAWKIFFDGR